MKWLIEAASVVKLVLFFQGKGGWVAGMGFKGGDVEGTKKCRVKTKGKEWHGAVFLRTL